MDKVRVDKYLWAIRIFKTRTLAKTACEGGRIKLSGKSLKPAHVVAVGDQYEINTSARLWIIKVVSVVEKRLAYPEAIKCYTDLTPEEEKVKKEKQTASFYTGKRLSKTGKPTRKQRQSWEDFYDQ